MKPTVYIPEPCHENWDKMTPKEKGRFCDSCAKVVVDFTKKTNDEIMNYLTSATGKTCGNFTYSQLNPDLQALPVVHKTGWWKKACISFLAFLGVFGLGKNAKAQLKGKIAIRGDVGYYEYHNTSKTATVLSGQIKNSQQKTLANATIRVFSGDKQIAEAQTIANGTYSITLPAGTIVNSKITVWGYAPGYSGKKLENLDVKKKEMRLNITMDEEIQVLGMIAPVKVVDEPKKRPEVKEDTTTKVIQVKTPVVKNPETICENPKDEANSKEPIDSIQNTNPSLLNTQVSLLNTLSETTFKILPNPSAGEYVIEIGSHVPYHVSVKDISGKTILTKNHVLNRTRIDITSYANGVYFVQITDVKTGKVANTQKLVKQ